MGHSKKVVFFFPAFSSQEATAPLGILAVATPLLRAGYEVCLIDSTITPKFKDRVLAELKDALCLAVSLVTGPMIKETVDIARAAKAMLSGDAGDSWRLAPLPASPSDAGCSVHRRCRERARRGRDARNRSAHRGRGINERRTRRGVQGKRSNCLQCAARSPAHQ